MKGEPMIVDTLQLLVELVMLFFAVTFAVQLFQRRMGPDLVRAWMGGRPLVAALKGIAIGFLTPFCTFTAIPMLVGLRQAEVPAAGYVAFIVAAPVLDPVLFGALVIIVGPVAAVIYGAVALLAAVGLALLAERVGIERRLKAVSAPTPAPAPAPAGSAHEWPGPRVRGCETEPAEHDNDGSATEPTCGQAPERAPWRGLSVEARGAAVAATSLLRTMGPLLLLGVAISIVIELSVPPEVTQRLTAASPTFSIPIAAAVGTPLYVSTAVFVPIADSLTAAGVGIGAIVALTIAGAGANLPEFVILTRLVQTRVIAVFVGYVFGVAIVGGLLAEVLVTT